MWSWFDWLGTALTAALPVVASAVVAVLIFAFISSRDSDRINGKMEGDELSDDCIK